MRLFVSTAILRGLALLPLPAIHALGYLLGTVLALFPNRLRQTIRRNTELCFPELEPQQRHHLVRNSLVETAKALLETGPLWLRSGPRALQLIRRVEGLSLVQSGLAKGRGVILITPHLGSWEAAGLYGAATFGMTGLYRPLRLPELETLVRNARSRLGARYVPATPGGIRRLYRTLQQGGTVAMLPDQEPGSGAGCFTRYFNIPAWTMTLPVRLAGRTGAEVIFAWCRRLPRGRGFVLYFSPAPPAIRSGDIDTATQAMNQAIEALVRECPAQYQWGYRRFRKRPAGEPGLYTHCGPAPEYRVSAARRSG